MDGLLCACIMFALVMILFSTMCLCNPIWVCGSGFFRGCQRHIVAVQTAKWPAIENDHFIVKYQCGDEISARMVLDEATRVYQPLGSFFHCFPDCRVPILVYPDRVSLNRTFGWSSDESAMGVYWAGVVRVLTPVAWMGNIEDGRQRQVFQDQGPVAHEYTHLLVDCKTGGNYPRWLTEGIAQYAESIVTGGCLLAQERNAIADSTLEQMDSMFDDAAWQDYSYAVSRDIVSYLISRHGSPRIIGLLDALGCIRSVGKAFRETYGFTIKEFIGEYNDCVHECAVE